jgi:hypothetical protein
MLMTGTMTRKPARRKRGEAQKAVARYIIDHKRDDNGNSPTFAQIADHMGYAYPMCAYNIVTSIVAKNRPGRPHLIDLGDEYGTVWIDIDARGRPVVFPGRFVVENE